LWKAKNNKAKNYKPKTKAKEMKINFQTGVLLFAVAIIMFLLFDSCERNKEMYSQSVALSNYTDSVKTYKDKNGKLIDYNQSMKVSLDVAYANVAGLEDKIKTLKLKKPEVVIKYTNSVVLDSIDIPIEIPCDDFFLPFLVDSPHYVIDGTLTNRELKFNSIFVPNEQTFVVAKKKPKWYKGSEYVVVVDNSNPYIRSQGLQSYTIKPEKEFYEKWYFLVGAGVLGGLILDNMVK